MVNMMDRKYIHEGQRIPRYFEHNAISTALGWTAIRLQRGIRFSLLTENDNSLILARRNEDDLYEVSVIADQYADEQFVEGDEFECAYEASKFLVNLVHGREVVLR